MNNHLTPREVTALKREVLSSLHCALPGIVESFDPEAGTAAVRPAVKKGGILLPLLRDVPVYLPEPREIAPGSFCLLVFADCDLDAFLESGEAEEPNSARQHSLSDAFAFVGFRAGNRERRFTHDPSSR